MLINLDAAVGGDVDMAIGRKQCDQENEAAGEEGRYAGAIKPGEWLLRSGTICFSHHPNEPAIEPIQQ